MVLFMKNIVITNIEYIEVDGQYTNIRHRGFPKFSSVDRECPVDMICFDDMRDETIRSRRFRSSRTLPDGKIEKILDISIGVSTEVQKALGIYVEGATDAIDNMDKVKEELRKEKSKTKSLTVELNTAMCAWDSENIRAEKLYEALQEHKSMPFFQRLKWAFTK